VIARMTNVVELSVEQLRAQRVLLLERVRMNWPRLAELANAYALDSEERNIYDSIRAIDYLLGDDAV
jgi:hypothetical protein